MRKSSQPCDYVRMGAHILRPMPGLADVLPIVLEHHEWFDGKGYPAGLAGEAISLDARIFAVADCFDAMASDRPYRAGMPIQKVIEIIKGGSGSQYDPKVIAAFIPFMEEKQKNVAVSEQLLQTAPLGPLTFQSDRRGLRKRGSGSDQTWRRITRDAIRESGRKSDTLPRRGAAAQACH